MEKKTDPCILVVGTPGAGKSALLNILDVGMRKPKNMFFQTGASVDKSETDQIIYKKTENFGGIKENQACILIDMPGFGGKKDDLSENLRYNDNSNSPTLIEVETLLKKLSEINKGKLSFVFLCLDLSGRFNFAERRIFNIIKSFLPAFEYRIVLVGTRMNQVDEDERNEKQESLIRQSKELQLNQHPLIFGDNFDWDNIKMKTFYETLIVTEGIEPLKLQNLKEEEKKQVKSFLRKKKIIDKLIDRG